MVNFEDCFENKDASFFNQKFKMLNTKLYEVIENFNLIQYTTTDIMDEESMMNLIMHIDNLVQYDEFRMPKDSAFLDNQEQNNEEN